VSKPSDTLTKKQREEIGLVQAIHRRDRLLEFDKQYAQRTTIIDDQIAKLVFGENTDQNLWLTEEEKTEVKKKEKRMNELLEKQENRSRRMIKFKIDFLGRKILEDNSEELDEREEMKNLIKEIRVTQNIPSSSKKKDKSLEHVKTVIAPNIIHPSILNGDQLEFLPSSETDRKQKNNQMNKTQEKHKKFSVVQDEILRQEYHTNDKGYIMSMHQPWASLLVYGIKKHEGRSWTHSHRGRLWIASTVQEPSDSLIKEWEMFYKKAPLNRTSENGYEYPKHYPCGFVLGCIDVEDILSQEEYRQQFPDESDRESDSDYVFICSNPRRLIVPLPISGKPKIYKLSKEDLKKCQEGLAE
jgi:hypothetical protein